MRTESIEISFFFFNKILLLKFYTFCIFINVRIKFQIFYSIFGEKKKRIFFIFFFFFFPLIQLKMYNNKNSNFKNNYHSYCNILFTIERDRFLRFLLLLFDNYYCCKKRRKNRVRTASASRREITPFLFPCLIRTSPELVIS